MTRLLWRFVRQLWHEHHGAMLVVSGASVALLLTEGMGLLMLLPMLHVVGIALGDAPSDRIVGAMQALLRALGVAPTLPGVLLVVVGLVTARAALQWLSSAWEARLEVAVIGRLRQRLFEAVVHLPWSRFAGERPAALVHAIGPQVEDVHSALLTLLQLASLLAAASAAVAVALLVSPALTGLMAIIGVGIALAARALRAPGRADGERLLEAAATWYARVSELLGGMKMVHAHGAEAQAVSAVASDTAAWTSLTRHYAQRRARVRAVLAVLAVVVLAGLVWMAVTVVHVAPATLLLLLLLYVRLVPQLAECQSVASSLSQFLASFDSISALLARCERVRDEEAHTERVRALRHHEGARAPSAIAEGALASGRPPSVELRDVTVRYPGGRAPALAHVDARFPSGALSIVVGASGAGKTTLADVLLGLLEAEEGLVLVNGAAMTRAGRATWRARVGYLAQEPMLFHGSIRENLLFARPDATDDDVRAALRDAACDFVTRLPQGVDAPVGDRGVLLSGGERQRLALARALLRAPDLLVLDEATSALDAETEKRILETLSALKGRCTMVFCTHRNAVRAVADQVISLDVPP